VKSAWQIGRIAGIVVRIHVTFPLLLIWVAVMQLQQGGGWEALLKDEAFILVVFFIIVLHELGHARMARHFGIGTHDITLLPIGGVARLERMPEKPSQELAVALAGPAVNAVLAALFWPLSQLFPSDPMAAAGNLLGFEGGWLVALTRFNVVIALFNLLPAFPMDGGRVLRALLAMRLSPVRATEVAASVGRGMALLFGILGLAFNPFFILLAIFVWMGAGAEAAATHLRAAVAGMPVERLMIAHPDRIAPTLSLGAAMERMIANGGQMLAVGEDGNLDGLLSRSDLMAALARHGADQPVSVAMRKKFGSVEATDEARAAIRKMDEAQTDTLPVFRDGRMVGFLTRENLAAYVGFHHALESAARQRTPPVLRS